MKDREWCKKVEEELNTLKERVRKLEGTQCSSCSSNLKEIELEIEWPAAEISGLRFGKHTSRGVFELDDDGNYYSRDILFHSARDTDDGTGIDLLTMYLASEEVTKAFYKAATDAGIKVPGELNVFLPEAKRGEGIKTYNGVRWWYWLKPRAAGSSTSFVNVNSVGYVSGHNASSVGGCAPAFCVA